MSSLDEALATLGGVEPLSPEKQELLAMLATMDISPEKAAYYTGLCNFDRDQAPPLVARVALSTETSVTLYPPKQVAVLERTSS